MSGFDIDSDRLTAEMAEHNTHLNAAITTSAKGGSFVLDAHAHAQRCLKYLKDGVGLKPDVQVSSKFVCELDWGVHGFMQELFDAYVHAGFMGLDRRQDFPVAKQVLPLEAAIFNGNISAVEACIRHGDIPTVLTRPMYGPDRAERHTLEELADICNRPGMRGPIKAVLATLRAREEAVQTAEAMRDVISQAGPACVSPLSGGAHGLASSSRLRPASERTRNQVRFFTHREHHEN